MTWVDDICSWCREGAEYHRWCEVEQRLVCNGGCDHEGCVE